MFDEQIGRIICSLELPDSWRERMASLAVSDYDGPSLADLREKRRRLIVGYGDGGYGDREYKARLAEIDAQIEAASAVVPPGYEEAIALFSNISNLWKEATQEERRKLVSPLIECVYVDLDLKLVGAITPTPAFRVILMCAIQKSRSEVVLVSPDDAERLKVWSWWRRGRVELPVQRKGVEDLLQA